MTRSAIRIERKREGSEKAARTLRRALAEKRLLDVTAAEAAAATGMPLGLCTEALFVLAGSFKARLRVDEAGVIRFTFATLKSVKAESAMTRRWRELRTWLRRHEARLYAVGTALLAPPALWAISGNSLAIYDAAQLGSGVPGGLVIAACLFSGIAFALSFVIMAYNAWVMVALVLAFGLVTGHLQGAITVAAAMAFYRALFVGGAMLGTYLNPVRAEQRAAQALDVVALAGSFRRSLQGFLFGPFGERSDALSDERRLTAFIAQQGGVVTPGDLIGLFGWNADEVNAHLPRLMVDYGGDLVVTEQGALVCRFDPLKVTLAPVAPEPTALGRELEALGVDPAAMGFATEKVYQPVPESAKASDIRPVYEREGAPELWGCSNVFVLCAFVAMGVALTGPVLNPEMVCFPDQATWAALAHDDRARVFMQGFGVTPYLAALLPTLLRLQGWRSALRDYRAASGFRALLRVAMEAPAGRLMTGVDTRALARLGGEIDVARSEGEQVWVCFPLLESAAAEAARLRSAGPAAKAETVYDTHAG